MYIAVVVMARVMSEKHILIVDDETTILSVLKRSLEKLDGGYIMTDSGNRRDLTARELEILRLLAAGCSNREIADRTVITVRTVKFHTGNIYTKLAVRSRAEAIAWAWKNGQVGNT